MEELKIISKSEAKAAGLNRYFTGKPCPQGHIAERMVTNKSCVSCLNGRKRVRPYNSEKSCEYSRSWRKANLEKSREINRNRRKDDPEKYKAIARASMAKARAADPEKYRKAVRASVAKKYSAEVLVRLDRGLSGAKASGRLLDLNDALNIFKAQDNAFEFLETHDDNQAVTIAGSSYRPPD